MNVNYKENLKHFKKTMIILCKLIISLILSYLIIILPLAAYSITRVPIPFTIIIFLIFFLILYANWSIWSKGLIKKLLMFLFFMILSISGTLWGMDYMGIQSDYCIEDGDCKEGRIIYVDKKEILINKDTCIKNNWKWYEKGKYCKIYNSRFSVKEVIYD